MEGARPFREARGRQITNSLLASQLDWREQQFPVRLGALISRDKKTLIKGAFQNVSTEKLQQLELMLKKIGKRAESLADRKGHPPFGTAVKRRPDVDLM